MLAPSQRVELFRFQLSNRRVFRDTRFNFGPIVQCQNFEAQHFGSVKPDQFLTVAELVPTPPPLTLDTPWPNVSDDFRRQFAFSVRLSGEFANISQVLREKVNPLRTMARRLATDPSPEDAQSIARELWLLGDLLHDYGEFYKVFAIPNTLYTNRELTEVAAKIQQTFVDAKLFVSDKKYNLHKSYFGTTEDWRWFLEAEARGLDANKSVDLYKLAAIYSEHLRHTPPGKRRRNVQTGGFRGAKVPSRLLKNRRATVLKHLRTIQKWIDGTYPPQPPTQ